MKCPHQFRVISTEINDQRKVYHLRCSLCKATRRRNRTLKRFQPPKGSGQGKQGNTSQNGLKRQRKAIPKVSQKRKKQLEEYSRLREAFLKDHPWCAVFPRLRSTQIHHGMGREGEWLLRTEHWHAVSDEGHHKIENNRKWAKENGFLKLRITTTTT
jgi:ElaB/YqjD/DUF883 family membrane-anchored ribosome-binding protein